MIWEWDSTKHNRRRASNQSIGIWRMKLNSQLSFSRITHLIFEETGSYFLADFDEKFNTCSWSELPVSLA